MQWHPNKANNPTPEGLVGDIRHRLAAMHGQWRKALFWRGVARVTLAGLLGLCALCALDALFQAGFRIRLALCLTGFGAWFAFAWRTWLRYWLQPYSATSMAWILESVFPEFHERLVSAVELADGTRDRQGISEKLVCETLVEARADLDTLAPQAVFPIRWSPLKAPAAVAAAMVLLLAVPGLDVPQRIGRVALPSPSDPSLGSARLELSPGTLVRNEGDAMIVRVKKRGRPPADVELFVREANGPGDGAVRRFVMRQRLSTDWYDYELSDLENDFWLWAQAGSIRSRSHRIRVRQRPVVERLTLHYRYPEHTRLPDEREVVASGAIRAVHGTRVDIVLAATQALQGCTVVLDGRRLPVTPGKSEREVDFTVPVLKDGAYTVELTNRDGLLNRGELVYEVRAIPDVPPEVVLLSPLADVHVDTGQGVDVRWRADDDFGIASQAIVLTLAGGRPLARIELDAAARSRTVVPSRHVFGYGRELLAAVAAIDHAGQETRSAPLAIFLGGGEMLAKLDDYLRTCRHLLALFARLDDELNAVQTYARHLEVHAGMADADPHYRLMTSRKITQIREGLTTVQSVASTLKDGGVIPEAVHGAELLRLYGEQELLFSLPELDRGTTESAAHRLRALFRLGEEMALALQEKGEDQRRHIHLQRHRQTLAAMPLQAPEQAAEQLALFVAELAESFPQWADHLPTEARLADEAADTLDSVVQELGERLDQMVEQAREKVADHRRLERAAAAIEGKLRGMENQLRKLAESLRRDGSEVQWGEARELARNYLAVAARETDPVRRADAELVAEVVARAADERRPNVFDDAAAALAAFRSEHQARRQSERRAATGQPPRADDESESERARADALRTRLTSIVEPKSETVARTAETLARTAANINLPDIALSDMSAILGRAQRTLAETARKFRDEANRDSVVGRGRPFHVMEKVALAQALENVRTEDVAPARGRLAQTAAGFEDEARRTTRQVLAAAAQSLDQGSRRLYDIADLARRHEQAASGRLSPNDMARVHADMHARLAPLLPDRLREALLEVDLFDTFANLAAARVARAETDGAPTEVATLGEALRSRLATTFPEALEASRRAAIEQAQTLVADLHESLLDVKAALDGGETDADRQPLLLATERHGRELTQALARVDIANAWFVRASSNLAQDFLTSTLPTIEQGLLEARSGRFPSPSLDEAGTQLAVYSESLTTMLRQPIALATTDSPLTTDGARFSPAAHETLVELEKILLQGEGLQATLRDVTAPAREGVDNASKIEAMRRRIDELATRGDVLTQRLEEDLDPLADSTRERLTSPRVNLRHHVAAGDFASALANLDAIRTGLHETPRKRSHGERPDFAGERTHVPELVENALAGLDLDALKGVALELAKEHADGTFAGNPAVVAAAIAGAYRQAAEMTTGMAAYHLDRAARRREVLGHPPAPTIPLRFSAPRDPVAEHLERRMAEQARTAPLALARETLVQLDGLRIADEGAPTLANAAHRAKLAVAEAMRAALGWRAFPAMQAARRLTEAAEENGTIDDARRDLLAALDDYDLQVSRLIDELAELNRLAREIAALEQLAQTGREALTRLADEHPSAPLKKVLSEAIQVPALPPVDRRILAQALSDLPRLGSPLAKARAVGRAADALSGESFRLANQLRRMVAAVIENPDVQQAEMLLGMRRATLAEKIRLASDALARHQSIPAEEAQSALAKALDSLAGDDWQGVGEHLARGAVLLAEMSDQTPAVIPFNDAAYSAVAMAVELRNREAVGHANVGDYRAAAESMVALARALGGAPGRARLAETAARRFLHAEQEAREALPHALRQALDAARTVDKTLPQGEKRDALCRRALTAAFVATHAQTYRRASLELARAMACPDIRTTPEFQELAERLEEAETHRRQREERLPPAARRALATLRQPTNEFGALPFSQANKATTAIDRRDYAAAVEHLRVAREATANPAVQRQVAQAIALTSQAEEDDGGGLSAPTRRLLRVADGNMPDTVQALIEDERLAFARLVARERGENELAERLSQAIEQRVRNLPPAAEKPLRTLVTLADRETLALPPDVLADAFDLAVDGHYEMAAKAIRQAAGPLRAAGELAWEIDAAEAETSAYLSALETIVESCRTGDFNRAWQLASRLDDAGGVPAESTAKLQLGREHQRAAARLAYAASWQADTPEEALAFARMGDALLAGDLPLARETLAKRAEPTPDLLAAVAELENLALRDANTFNNLLQDVANELLEHVDTLALRARDAGRLATLQSTTDVAPATADAAALTGEIMTRVSESLAAGDLADARNELAALPQELPTAIAVADRLLALAHHPPVEPPLVARPVSPAALAASEGLLQLDLAAAPWPTAMVDAPTAPDDPVRAAQTALRRAAAMAADRVENFLARETPVAERPEASGGIAFPQRDPVPDFAPWRDVGAPLPLGGTRAAMQSYADTYYREANQAYLEKVAREGKRWSE